MTHYTSPSYNILKADFVILKFWLIAYLLVDISKAHSQFLEISRLNDSVNLKTKEDVARVYPFKMELFFKSLKELAHEEIHNRKKKSVTPNEKRIAASEMRNKIQELMSNISRTLSDVDWYFAYEQLEDQKNKEKNIANYQPTPELVIKRMREVDDRNSDAFVDSFIQQMYEMDPSILDKISDRISEQFSNVKRQIRFAPGRQTEKAINRKANIDEIVAYEEPFVYSDYTIYNDEFSTEISEKVSDTSNYLADIDHTLRHDDSKLVINDLDYTDTSSSTTQTTTVLEGFYDYGDYYKDSDDQNKIRDISHYEIIQDILQSTNRYKGFTSDFKNSKIKNQYKKTRNFDKSKEILKKRLKNNLKNYEKSKKHKVYNINYNY